MTKARVVLALTLSVSLFAEAEHAAAKPAAATTSASPRAAEGPELVPHETTVPFE
jgi:hypothetical protein